MSSDCFQETEQQLRTGQQQQQQSDVRDDDVLTSLDTQQNHAQLHSLSQQQQQDECVRLLCDEDQ